ncbi:hypothetical protein CBR_g57056 [Chara braunii]|uniref:Uncharacterized protein n=1 Tax=Chara braunii TaxID=69332 RepID=A0A388K7Y6_CHABU|nr:hypothetical protein CBR_g57056 [Chara braunii]|eukprot:GBG66174.1 hypothetical protein CBR_g57056 [Chara braunii]
MKAFDVRGNRTEFQMLDPEKFLSKTNGYRVTGSLPVVDSAFMLSRPLVQFNSPADQLAAFVMRYREEFSRLPVAQQVDRVFVPIDAPSSSAAGPKRRQDQPSRAGGKRKQLSTAPFSSAAVLPSDWQGRDAAELSSEATDYDDGAVRYRAGPRHRSRGGAGAFDDEECEGQDGEGGGWDGEGGGEEREGGGEEEEGGGEGDDGNEGDVEGEDDGMDEERDDVGEEVEDNRSSQFHRRHHNESQGRREDDACHVGDAVDAGGQPAASRGMSQSYDQTNDGRDEPGSRRKRKRGEASTSHASRTKQARADAVNEARGALTASQEARAPRKIAGGRRSGSRGGGRGGGRKGSQRSRAPELRDSGDEGEGVGPRMPEDIEELVQHAASVDMTRCFFLEYDEQGFARQDVQVVNVDVNRIKPIPRGKILFNHRSLSKNIVRGIESVIENSISADPGVWDRLELVLAPVDPNVIVGGQGRRITPDEFFQRNFAEFDWYAVCGQHTAEAMKRLVGKGSPAVKVYGLRTYSKVGVVFFDDDHTHRYFNVSLFDNTRENRAMMLSFQEAVRDMRQWWIDNNRIEAPKAKALDNEYSKDWSNKRRGYLNLATSTRTVWPLMEKFFAMFEEGNNVIDCDESAKDIAYLTKFVDILVKYGKFECRLKKPQATHRTNRDMYHKLGPKRLKVWEYLFRDALDGRLDGGYIYRKAKVTEVLKHYHGALTGAFETFGARCEILRFDLHKDKLTFKDYADLVKSGEGFNPVDSEEDSPDSDLEIEKGTNATGWCGKSAAMEHSVKGYGPGQSEGCSNLPPANSVASGVDRVVCMPVEDDEDDDLDIPAQPTKLASSDPIPPRFCADANNVYFLDDKYACTSEDKWGHDIIWHDGIFEPCIQGGEWKMAVKYVSKGWRLFPRMGKDNWLKTTEQSILYRCRKENPGESETSIAAKAKQLFDALGATRQLEYSQVERAAALESMDVDSREDAASVPEAATGNTTVEQREDGRTTFGVKPPLSEAGNTPAGKNTIRAISVATGDTSQGEKVSLDKLADAGATYGSLLATGAALAGTSEMVSQSTAGMGVTGMSLHPPTCTSKGDAHCTTTAQGRVTGDDGNGGNAGGSPRSRNIEDMTTDDEDGVEGGKGVNDPTRAKNEG